MKADLHLHSEYSWDSKVPIKSYILKAEKMGFGAISITDHNDTQSHDVIKTLQFETDVILVPGQEINTLDGHLLIYGWLPTVDRALSMKDTIIQAKEMAGDNIICCIAAHPFDKFRGGKGNKIFETGIDGLEILNASALLGWFNKSAKKNSENLQLIKAGNSDSHRMSEFGMAWTDIPTCSSIVEVLLNLKDGVANGTRIGIKRKSVRYVRRKIGKMTD